VLERRLLRNGSRRRQHQRWPRPRLAQNAGRWPDFDRGRQRRNLLTDNGRIGILQCNGRARNTGFWPWRQTTRFAAGRHDIGRRLG
jgi:hypothetical protein